MGGRAASEVVRSLVRRRVRMTHAHSVPALALSWCITSRATRKGPKAGSTGERPRPRDRGGDVIPTALPVAATTLARVIPGTQVPSPNILSAKHLGRISGGLLYAATSNVSRATLLARTFDIDVKA